MKRYKLSQRKLDYARYYLLSGNKTFSNAYRSSLKAGYSDSYARRISAHMNWVELAILAEKQGVVLDDRTRKYVQRYI